MLMMVAQDFLLVLKYTNFLMILNKEAKFKDCNGVDIKQTSRYIAMSCESYIKRLWKSHDWETTISTLNFDIEVN